MITTEGVATFGSRSTISGWGAISLSPESRRFTHIECIAASIIQQPWDLTSLPYRSLPRYRNVRVEGVSAKVLRRRWSHDAANEPLRRTSCARPLSMGVGLSTINFFSSRLFLPTLCEECQRL